MSSKTDKLLALLKGQPVIPVLKIDDARNAVPLARALARGGLPVIEITMRTPDALEVDPPCRGGGSRSGGRRRHDPHRRAVRAGRRGRLEIHRQPGRHRRRSLPRRATAPCRCCPARSRRAR